eukprot:m.213866 g.213866  ORF g.213866 m.213866 type:complete len:89 (+) comp19063_c0_seq4:1557-1823(+)
MELNSDASGKRAALQLMTKIWQTQCTAYFYERFVKLQETKAVNFEALFPLDSACLEHNSMYYLGFNPISTLSKDKKLFKQTIAQAVQC